MMNRIYTLPTTIICNKNRLLLPRRRKFSTTHKQQTPEHQHNRHHQLHHFSWLIFALTGGYCVKEYVFDTTVCDGPSMLPTIQEKGVVILYEKFSHRIFGLEGGSSGYDRALRNRRQHQRRIEINNNNNNNLFSRLTSSLSIGDVVVVQQPTKNSTVCKRIIGLPGDVIEIHPSMAMKTLDHIQDIVIVPDGHIWIEGDNSRVSIDSRYYGPVPAALVLGKVLYRVWPITGNNHLIERNTRRPIILLDDHDSDEDHKRKKKSAALAFTGSKVTPAGLQWTS